MWTRLTRGCFTATCVTTTVLSAWFWLESASSTSSWLNVPGSTCWMWSQCGERVQLPMSTSLSHSTPVASSRWFTCYIVYKSSFHLDVSSSGINLADCPVVKLWKGLDDHKKYFLKKCPLDLWQKGNSSCLRNVFRCETAFWLSLNVGL